MFVYGISDKRRHPDFDQMFFGRQQATRGIGDSRILKKWAKWPIDV